MTLVPAYTYPRIPPETYCLLPQTYRILQKEPAPLPGLDLIAAAQALNVGKVKRLLNTGINPNYVNLFDETALTTTIRFGGMIGSFKLDHWESVKSKITYYNKQRYAVVEALLEHKANANEELATGTPLQYLFDRFFPEEIDPKLVTLLVAHGAKPKNLSQPDRYVDEICAAIVEGEALYKASSASDESSPRSLPESP